MTHEHKALPGLLTPEATLHRLADQLATRFAGVFTRETIDRYVFESYTALVRTAKVTTHLPVLTERFATERLTALAQAKGAIEHDGCEIPFRLRAQRRSLPDGRCPHGSPRRQSRSRSLGRLPAHGKH